ncbi:hypothetical protein F3Y22_tig00112762pilonHSYRG00005 [Hibiscus syriacus]|uniref:Uncharacterized protein n=1 Tax=Hibiscus syriacus TaxID=106335 RepID=A0A6A2XR33_HIBSY|nr:uncharacterized protein LOC120183412 [Hibiscus syriacus]KAE8664446.1 hypothetical protein F3Y22_tig00112762pilonHSYRG00005 [Hibiscus syriacus]
MEGRKQPTFALAIMLLLMVLWSMSSPAVACPLKGDGNGCKDCVVQQMSYGCPSCVPLIRCMTRCLWGGAARSDCMNRCDCNDGKPTLSDCKKCMSRCKCSCVA